MKEKELREAAECALCHRKIGASKSPIFFRVRVERYMLDMNACQRQTGLGMMIGAPLAHVMGPDEDLAKRFSTNESTVCNTCANKNHVILILALEKEEDGQCESQ